MCVVRDEPLIHSRSQPATVDVLFEYELREFPLVESNLLSLPDNLLKVLGSPFNKYKLGTKCVQKLNLEHGTRRMGNFDPRCFPLINV